MKCRRCARAEKWNWLSSRHKCLGGGVADSVGFVCACYCNAPSSKYEAPPRMDLGEYRVEKSESEKPVPDFVDLIRPFVNAQVQSNYDAVETMCWEMLKQADTKYGVLVEGQPNGSVKVSLSPYVEFLTIVWVKDPLGGGLGHGE